MSEQSATVLRHPECDAPATPLLPRQPGRNGTDRGRASTSTTYLAARAKLATAAVMCAARWTPYVEPEMLGLPGIVGPGSVCIDVGSAAGLYTLALSHLAGPSGQVHSVEPLFFAHPACARLLRARDADNVRHHGVALGGRPGRAVMSVPVRRSGFVTGRSFLAQAPCRLGPNSEFDRHAAVVVDVETLDDLCEQNGLACLDFVKVDVEGAELQVLEGGREAIAEWRPAILAEIEARHTARYGYTPDDVVAWLARRGYAMYAWQRGWHRADGVCPHSRNYLFRATRGAAIRGQALPEPPGATPRGARRPQARSGRGNARSARDRWKAASAQRG
ncbi:MAG: FkbM family methyltransferase [Acidimicrobiales bacterium]